MQTERSATGFGRFLGAMQEMATGHKISGVAGGSPLQLRGEDGEIELATNLPEWTGLRFREGIANLFDCPIYLGNDAEVCGLGEAHFGAGTTEGVMAYYTVSTGVNAARIVGGELDATIGQYELGYQVVDHIAGKPRSLESMIGGAELEKRLGVPPQQVRDKEVWAGLERYLAAGIYNTMLYWDPEVVVFGGKMMRDLDLQHVSEVLEGMPKSHDAWPRLVSAQCGDNAGLLGAMTLLAQHGHK